MDRKTYEWSKKTSREAYEQAIRDSGGGGLDPHDHPHNHLGEYAPYQHEHQDEHEHEDLQAQVDHNEDRINALEHELEALADTREAGEWEYKNVWELRGSGFGFTEAHNFTKATNIMEITKLDSFGNTHGFARVEVGDYVEIVQEHDTRAVGDYGLYAVSAVRDGGSDTKIFDLTLEQGKGAPTLNSKCLIKFFHLNENLDLAELDARYVSKSGQQDIEQGRWWLRQKNAEGNWRSYIDIKADGKLGLYHVQDPGDDAHAVNRGYLNKELDKKADTHSHPYASSSHTHNYASSSHTHSYASTNHTHSKAKMQTGTNTNPSLTAGEMYLNTSQNVVYVGT